MVIRPFDNSILDGLCSNSQLELLDSVDRLRSQGIDHYVSLPQIIVCGDQSSGKSSVLEAISGVSFPVKSNLCTRFPTELILRKAPNVGVSVSIVPHHSHNKAEHDSLSSFCQKLDGFDELPELIDNAKAAMAIGSFGRAFSKDLLRIEVSGPDRPHLTIVDLPGLIHSETKHQSAADVDLVQDVVKTYMEEPRSIILAVVSAKNDYANQIVLKLARAADKTGTRTLGVITKPDTLKPGSDSEAMYSSLAQNLDVDFRLGWHVLKNMDSETGSWPLPKRDREEQHFFSQGIWTTLPGNLLGISMLRERLSKLLLVQIAAELPGLIEEIGNKSNRCRTLLQKLGQPRASIDEQRLYLINLSQKYQSLTKAAVDGTYNDDFFGNARTNIGYQKRIRAVIQNINESFSETIARKGHYYTIIGFSSERSSRKSGSKGKVLTRAEFLDRIDVLMKRTRGRELPGTFNPMIISDLFVEQSKPWEALARSHIEEVAHAVESFLKHLIAHIADTSTSGALFEELVKPALEQIINDMKAKTADLLAPHQSGHPITYNHDYSEAVQQVREERMRVEFTHIIQKVFGVEELKPRGQSQYVDTDYRPLLNELMENNNPGMNEHACSEAFDCMQAYYKVALKRFVDDIAVEAVEKIIVAKLEDILAPLKVSCLPTDVVTSVAGESEESRTKRKQLTNQLDVLLQGLETCRRFLVGSLQGTQNVAILQERSRPWSPPSSSDFVGTDYSDDAVDDELTAADAPPTEACEEWGLPPEVEPLEQQQVLEAVTELLPDDQRALPSKKKKGKKGKSEWL